MSIFVASPAYDILVSPCASSQESDTALDLSIETYHRSSRIDQKPLIQGKAKQSKPRQLIAHVLISQGLLLLFSSADDDISFRCALTHVHSVLCCAPGLSNYTDAEIVNSLSVNPEEQTRLDVGLVSLSACYSNYACTNELGQVISYAASLCLAFIPSTMLTDDIACLIIMGRPLYWAQLSSVVSDDDIINSLVLSYLHWRRNAMYVCMYIFRPGGQRPRKVSYWSTGRAELNYLQLLSRWTPPRIPAMSTRINGEPLELLPPRAPSYS
ncbi:Uncharacterized protein HZ326_25146 [Fusarium oxysporum f. sp. albedinis]|nr:Uncharacterized protein HZ326_25146 [Fusarium oxysporum f. sp. albedinis]